MAENKKKMSQKADRNRKSVQNRLYIDGNRHMVSKCKKLRRIIKQQPNNLQAVNNLKSVEARMTLFVPKNRAPEEKGKTKRLVIPATVYYIFDHPIDRKVPCRRRKGDGEYVSAYEDGSTKGIYGNDSGSNKELRNVCK